MRHYEITWSYHVLLCRYYEAIMRYYEVIMMLLLLCYYPLS